MNGTRLSLLSANGAAHTKASYSLYNPSDSLHGASRSLHNRSVVLHKASYSLHKPSDSLHGASCDLRNRSVVLHKASYSLRGASHIPLNAAFILHKPSNSLRGASHRWHEPSVGLHRLEGIEGHDGSGGHSGKRVARKRLPLVLRMAEFRRRSLAEKLIARGEARGMAVGVAESRRTRGALLRYRA